MSSSVFYKFKNQKEPERITFHGTGISVFELKREIITATGLGDGSDFDLHLYPEDDPTSEYNDDTTVIQRTNTVIVARRPAARGHGKAARYVSGKAPVRALPKPAAKSATPATGAAAVLDAEAAFLAESEQAWEQQKEALSQVKSTHHKKKPINVPNHDPPAGYVCYRCHQKGHWIQLCPTNDDPDFKPVARPKRTTGIPRSFLKTVEKPVDEEDARGVMLNAEGEYVQVMTDTKTWEKFQEKANAAKAHAAEAEAVNKEAQKRGFACPIDKRMFVDPVKTPCCSKTYCHECIENALADEDLVCPGCGTENVLIDELAADEEMVQKVKAYMAEKAKEKADKEQQANEEAQAAAKPSTPNNEDTNSVPPADETTKAGKPTSSDTPIASGNGSDSDTSGTSKKRKDPPTEIKPPTAPKAMRQQKEQQQRQAQDTTESLIQNFQADMEAMFKGNPNMPVSMPMPANPMMAMANAPNMNGMGMNGGMNGFPMNGNWNNSYNQGFPNNMGYGGNMNQGWNGYNNNMGFGNMPNQMNGMNSYGGGWNQHQGYNNNSNNMAGWQGQQDAYERKPLNPHRSQNKHRKARAPDFHVL
ncbi:DWNN-domain-containing protein [Paraphaeosphaeria sporulosa]|uniref:DWNN-domain-containing protein n=1 Tax=Paraphaeosphaeria sporulosa TaxID=1460663 RepID=A0A177C7D2_9PLEO|nr:DWNN-domain-containing protein [Paraphaeosphaeria sporulosa]OAG03455.1 DWNN-domain-containing protein [Paraphaeosphaeria sporulosa]